MIAALEKAADALWPRRCPVKDCRRPSDRPGRFLCSRCFECLPWYDDSEDAATAYLDPMPELVNAFKFSNALWLARDLAEILEKGLFSKKSFDPSCVDVVIPVPLHPKRRLERGYNQSELLARSLAGRLNRRLDTRSLVRARDTEHQTRVSGKERLVNLSGAFKVSRPEFVRGRTVLLIDDVSTTGATFRECTRALKRADVWRVIPFCLSKALMDDDVG